LFPFKVMAHTLFQQQDSYWLKLRPMSPLELERRKKDAMEERMLCWAEGREMPMLTKPPPLSKAEIAKPGRLL
jgi:hypothetical protein